MSIRTFAVTALTAAALLPSAPTLAVNKNVEVSGNATAICQGALPNFEGSIRKRPLAVQNEGSANSFVTCSFLTQYDSANQAAVSYFGAYFTNFATVARTVTCTGVAGHSTNVGNQFVSKSVTVAPGGELQTQLLFTIADNGNVGYYPLVSMSCNIPPGVGINDTYVGYVVSDD